MVTRSIIATLKIITNIERQWDTIIKDRKYSRYYAYNILSNNPRYQYFRNLLDNFIIQKLEI